MKAQIERGQMKIVQGYGDTATLMPEYRRECRAGRLRTLRLRQRPGPANSLGLVKFMFRRYLPAR